MKKKKWILYFVIFSIFIFAIYIIYNLNKDINYYKENGQVNDVRYSIDDNPQDNQENQSVIRVLAPYDTTVKKRLLLDIAKEYSMIPGHPGVEVRFISKNSFKKEVSINYDKGELEDIIICDNSLMPPLIDMNIFTDISSYLESSHKTTYYHGELWNNTRNDGKYYGIPLTCDPYVLIWNKNLLDDEVKIPKTWEEFIAFVEEAHKYGIYGLGIGAKQSEEVSAFFLQMLYSTGSSIREINGEGGMKLFDFLEYLHNNKLISPECINWTQTDLIYEFLNGKVGTMINNTSALSVLREEGVNFDVGVCIVPYEKKENYMFHGKNVGITSTANYKEALSFLDYLTKKDVVERIAHTTETIPVRIDIEYNFNYDNFGLSKDFINKQKLNGMAKSSLNSWFDISNAIYEGVYDLISGNNTSTTSIANTMQDRVRSAILDN